ncbi:hypothetical protein [Streptococcus infantis]|uniref:hypothetical protein n=1 Tax=Streptococcus infantis TaxID=68892 RepID=UPI0039C169FC
MNTMYIIVGFVVFWFLLFVVFMIANGNRKKKAVSFVSDNSDKAIVHLYCSKTKINGQNLADFNPITGENLEKVVALVPGRYTIEGVYKTTETRLNQTINIKSENISMDLDLEAGNTYSIAMYLYSPEERQEYENGKTDGVVLSVPLTIVVGSDFIKAYIICYKEK